jgi:hypothetical protein
VPFFTTWNADQKYHAGFVYMSMMAEEVENLLNSNHHGGPASQTARVGVEDGAESAVQPTKPFSVLDGLRQRYIEDLALDDTSFREQLFGTCECANMDILSEGFTDIKALQPPIDVSAFRNGAQALARLLLRTGDAIKPSQRDPYHVAAIVATKAIDFTEDFFHYCSHEVLPYATMQRTKPHQWCN